MNITSITIEHSAPIYDLHIRSLNRSYPVCICKTVRVVFNADGSITMEIDEEETGAGRAYVTVLAVT